MSAVPDLPMMHLLLRQGRLPAALSLGLLLVALLLLGIEPGLAYPEAADHGGLLACAGARLQRAPGPTGPLRGPSSLLRGGRGVSAKNCRSFGRSGRSRRRWSR